MHCLEALGKGNLISVVVYEYWPETME